VGTPLLCLVRQLTDYTEKWHKKAQQELEGQQKGDGEEKTKKSQSQRQPILGCLLILIVSQASISMLIAPSITPLFLLLSLSLIYSLLSHLMLGANNSVKANITNKAKKQPKKPRAASKSNSSSLSDPDGKAEKIAEESSDEDDPDGEDDLDVAGMTKQDAWKLLDDEVSIFIENKSTMSLFRLPEILLGSSMMMMVSRWSV
jgi:hypothetical protein